MTTIHTRTAPARRVPPAAKKPGPVTLAIRGLRPNEAPTWQIRQAQIDAEERAALSALRRRVADAVEAGIAFLDETDGDADLEADYATYETVPGMGTTVIGRSTDDELGDSGVGDLDGQLEQCGNGPFRDVVFA